MQATELLRLCSRYNRWINAKLMNALQGVEHPDKVVLKTVFQHGVRILNHIWVLDLVWMYRYRAAMDGTATVNYLEGITAYPQPVRMDQCLSDDISSLAAPRTTLDSCLDDFVCSLTEAQLATTIDYLTMGQARSSAPLGALLMHQFNHQTSHRGDVLALLPTLNIDIGNNDMVGVIGEWCQHR